MSTLVTPACLKLEHQNADSSLLYPPASPSTSLPFTDYEDIHPCFTVLLLPEPVPTWLSATSTTSLGAS